MLHLVDEKFHQMSLAVQMLVVVALLFAIASRWYNDLRSSLFEAVEKCFRIISLVSQEDLEVEIFDQLISLPLIVTLTSGQ